MKYGSYVTSTLLYGTLALIGIIGVFVAFAYNNLMFMLLAAVFTFVAADNFFCADHARACGYRVRGHYVFPPFLQGRVPDADKSDVKEPSASTPAPVAPAQKRTASKAKSTTKKPPVKKSITKKTAAPAKKGSTAKRSSTTGSSAKKRAPGKKTTARSRTKKKDSS